MLRSGGSVPGGVPRNIKFTGAGRGAWKRTSDSPDPPPSVELICLAPRDKLVRRWEAENL